MKILRARSEAAHTESRLPRWHVKHDRGRALVEKTLDELHERVWILKAGIRIEARDHEEFPVALDAPIDPPRPHFLALAPAPDLHSGHAGPSLPCSRIRSWPRISLQ